MQTTQLRPSSRPVATASAGIVYSKFNSAVLYASNDKEESFDELFWDMGRENFFKFFSMLGEMKGKDLVSTRKVIKSRNLLKQSLAAIENELKECQDNIQECLEDMETFRRKIRVCDQKMESTMNFTVKRTETLLTKVYCDEGFFAYNCRKCKRKTCKQPVRGKGNKELCRDKTCGCPPSEHFFQPFEWRQVEATETKTSEKMKKEYEAICSDKKAVEELLEARSFELDMATAKVLSLLEQVSATTSSLDSTALRYNAISPADYLSLMRSKVMEEQMPGYLTRLETLNRLQKILDVDKRTATTTKENKMDSQIGDRGRGFLLQEENKTDGKPCDQGRGHILPQQFEKETNSDGFAGKSTETKSTSSQPIEMSGVKSKLPADDHVCGATSSVSQLPFQTSAGGGGRGRGTSQPNASQIVGHPPGRPEDHYGSAVKDKSSNKSQSPTGNLLKEKDGENFSSDEETEEQEEKEAASIGRTFGKRISDAVNSIWKSNKS